MVKDKVSPITLFTIFIGFIILFFYSYQLDTSFREFVAPTRIQPRLFFFNGNGWLEYFGSEKEWSEVTYNEKMLKILSLQPKIILEADIPTENLTGAHSDLFSNMAASLQHLRSTSLGISYVSHREEINFANPYSVFGGSRFYHPAGIPHHYTESHPVHYPQLVLVNKKQPPRVDMLQGILSCSKEIQRTNRDCITYSKKLMQGVTIDNQQFFPTNPWFTAYSRRMAPMLYLPESMDWTYAMIIRTYVAQAIFRLIGSHVGVSGTNLETPRKNYPRINQSDSRKVDVLVFALKEWVKSVRNLEKKKKRTSVSLNALVLQVYEHLHEGGHVSKETLKGAKHWISAIEEINYNQEEELDNGKERFEEADQILSQPLPVVGAVYMWDKFAQQGGLVHAIYQGVYKDIKLVVDIQNKYDPKLESPLPMKTTYLNGSSGVGLLAYEAYLFTVDKMEKEFQAHEDVIIWHHDDLLVNLTFVDKFVRNENVFLAGLPRHINYVEPDWADTEVKRIELASNLTFKSSVLWVWTGGIQNCLKKMVEAEGYSFFEQENSSCSKLNPIIKKQFNETYLVWAHLFASQADFLGSRWKHPRAKDFHKNLKKMLQYQVFLEAAPSLAMRCTLSPEEIDQNYVTNNLHLVTWWDGKRNNVPAMRKHAKTSSFDMIHPSKLGNSEDHIRFALEFRGLTSQGL